MAYYVEFARVPLNAQTQISSSNDERPAPNQFIRLSCEFAKDSASARKRHRKCLGQLVNKLSQAAERSELELFNSISGQYRGSHALISDDQWLGTTIKPAVDQKPKVFFGNALKSPDKVAVDKMEIRSNVYPCVAYYEWMKLPATVKRYKGASRSRFRVYFPFEEALKSELAGISGMLKHWAGKAVTHSTPAHDNNTCALAKQIKANFPSITTASRRRNGESLVVTKPAVLDGVRKFVYVGVNDLTPCGNTFSKGADGRVYETSWLGGTFARKVFDLTETYAREAGIAARVSHPHVVHIFGSPFGDTKPGAAKRDVKPVGTTRGEELAGFTGNVKRPIAAVSDLKPMIEDVKPGATTWDADPFLLMELLDEDLYHFMFSKLEEQQKHKRWHRDETAAAASEPPFPLLDALDVLIQVAEGMEHLHERNVVHGDLKSKNILISAFELQKHNHVWLYLVKVADFGQAQDLDRWPTEPFVPRGGTTKYAAPEVLEYRTNYIKNKPIRDPKKIDVYSFGIVAYEVLTGQSPYSGCMGAHVLIERVLAGHRPSLDSLKVRNGAKPRYPDALLDLVASCWDAAPDRRPTFSAICKKILDMTTQASTAVKPATASSPNTVMSEQYSSKFKSKVHQLWHSSRNFHPHQF